MTAERDRAGDPDTDPGRSDPGRSDPGRSDPDTDPGRTAPAGGTARLRYLSDEWFRAADAVLADLTPLSTELSIGMEVTGGPDGDRRYRLVLGPDRVGVAVGPGDEPVRMRMGWAKAVEIAQGRTSAQRAFLDGDIQLGGDTAALLGHQAELAELDDRLGALRERTDYG